MNIGRRIPDERTVDAVDEPDQTPPAMVVRHAVVATAVLASVPAVIMLVVAQNYIATGATGGAVK